MGNRPYMVHQALGNETPCLKCHTDKRGPWVFEHRALKVEGCETCHNPHGSTNAKLLRRPVVFTVCLECHNGGGDGTRNAGVDIQSARHNLLDPKYQLSLGIYRRMGRGVVSFAFTENLQNFNNTPDVALQLGWAYSPALAIGKN